MAKTLIIIDHPNFSQSTVNRRYVDELRKYPEDFSIHNLQSSYPSGKTIDPVKEHSILSKYDVIVLQFPLRWFSTPSKIKEWCETVLTPDWAFKDAHNLEDKKIALCVSCGFEEASYTSKGQNKRSVEDYLAWLLRTFEVCRTKYKGSFILYSADDRETVSANDIADKAKAYVEFLKKLES